MRQATMTRANPKIQTMITEPKTIIRDTALILPLMVAAGFAIGGVWSAFGVLCTGAVMLGNLWFIGRLTRRFTAHAAGKDPNGIWASILLVAKFPVMIGLVSLLGWAFGGLPVVTGLIALVLAIFVRGVVSMLGAPPEDASTDVRQGS